ncbi:hypothetical protein NP233_g5085 [Leucocoprinus birnbaumii]|uniref:H-type lectin domain-containing protein n=1 Tax=Leucocoprinus birnbaumii TaxID=56174 RepID=A0AAD5VTK3_9AGAR|nr:hypothetical protein NP233_g5085 [Leucocoprinus birnbaumii]
MSTVTKHNTLDVRPRDMPYADNSHQIFFSRTFVDPPRLPLGLCELDIDRKANISANAMVEDITKESAKYDITSESQTILYQATSMSYNLAPGNLEILSGHHMRNMTGTPKGPESVRIDFDHPFVTPPKVLVFIRAFDFNKDRNWRLETTASCVDTEGFTLNIRTWGDSILYAAQATWVAYPEDRQHIFSASVHTEDLEQALAWDRPLDRFRGEIKFSTEFWERPVVFVALNKFDIDCRCNFTLKIDVPQNSVTTTGLKWRFTPEDNRRLYLAGATIIAVD